jgi:hypothetical protein
MVVVAAALVVKERKRKSKVKSSVSLRINLGMSMLCFQFQIFSSSEREIKNRWLGVELIMGGGVCIFGYRVQLLFLKRKELGQEFWRGELVTFTLVLEGEF